MEGHQLACECGQVFDNYDDWRDHTKEIKAKPHLDAFEEALDTHRVDVLGYSNPLSVNHYVDLGTEGEKLKIPSRLRDNLEEMGYEVHGEYINVALDEYDNINCMVRIWFEPPK